MRRPTQGLLMALLGAIMLRLSLTDAYLRYVTPWMKWPLAVSGVLLIALSVSLLLADRQPVDHGPEHEPDDGHGHDDGHDDGHGHGVPRATWLLLLPAVVAFVISPPQLGAYSAERRAGEAQVVARPDSVQQLDADTVVDMDVLEFIWRAQDGGDTIEGQQVALTGFVSYGPEESQWFVTEMVIGCCAADAMAYQVQVSDVSDGAERPARDTWVKVTGTYETGTGVDPKDPPVVVADSIEEVEPPKNTYG